MCNNSGSGARPANSVLSMLWRYDKYKKDQKECSGSKALEMQLEEENFWNRKPQSSSISGGWSIYD